VTEPQLIVDFKNVSFRYSTQTSVVLSDVSWSLPQKTWCSILGPNGVGKSTVLKLVSGELSQTSGVIHRNFQKDRLAYIPQVNHFSKTSVLVSDVVTTVRQSILEPNWIEKEKWEAIFGIKEIWNQNIATLSVGQRQRLVIGLYLLKPVDLLLLDEPTSGCDVNNANQIYTLLESVRESLGVTILHVSHEIHQVMAFAKEVICMGGDSHVHRHVGDLTHSELEHAYGCELQRLVHDHEHTEKPL
jgi:zinc transport system ATP-binding protein